LRNFQWHDDTVQKQDRQVEAVSIIWAASDQYSPPNLSLAAESRVAMEATMGKSIWHASCLMLPHSSEKYKETIEHSIRQLAEESRSAAAERASLLQTAAPPEGKQQIKQGERYEKDRFTRGTYQPCLGRQCNGHEGHGPRQR
jgi:hypothetical protein